MAIEVEVGNEIIEFPDYMTDAQIEEVLRREYPPTNPAPVAPKKPPVANIPAPQEAAVPLQPTKPQSSSYADKINSLAGGAMQGASANFSDEIIAGLATPAIYGGSRLLEKLGIKTNGLADKSLKETYQEAVGREREELKKDQKLNPNYYLGGEVGGAIFGAGKVAKPLNVGQFLSRGKTLSKLGKSSMLGAGVNALYGAGKSENPTELGQNLAPDAAIGAAFGAGSNVIAKGLGGAGSKIKNSNLAKRFLGSYEGTPKSSSDVFRESSKIYNQADEIGGSLSGDFTNKFINRVRGLTPQTKEGMTFSRENPFTQTVKDVGNLKNSKISLRGLQEIDEDLADRIDDEFINGKLSKHGKKIYDIQTTLREMVQDAKPEDIIGDDVGFQALKKGRDLWAKASRAREIEKIIERGVNSEVPATSIKSGLRTLMANPKRMRGYTDLEKKAIKDAINTGAFEGVFKLFGSGLTPLIAAGAGAGAAGTAGVYAGSRLSRLVSNKAKEASAQNIVDQILGNKRSLDNLTLPTTATLSSSAN